MGKHEVHGVRDTRHIGSGSQKRQNASLTFLVNLNGLVNPCAEVVERELCLTDGILNICCDLMIFVNKNHINTAVDIIFFLLIEIYNYRPLAVSV